MLHPTAALHQEVFLSTKNDDDDEEFVVVFNYGDRLSI